MKRKDLDLAEPPDWNVFHLAAERMCGIVEQSQLAFVGQFLQLLTGRSFRPKLTASIAETSWSR